MLLLQPSNAGSLLLPFEPPVFKSPPPAAFEWAAVMHLSYCLRPLHLAPR